MTYAFIKELDVALRTLHQHVSGGDEPSRERESHGYRRVCQLTLDDNSYRALWDEPILLQLAALFQRKPPDFVTFGEDIRFIEERTRVVSEINDFFFHILDSGSSHDDLLGGIRTLSERQDDIRARLESSDRLKVLRESDGRPSDKVGSMLEFLRDDLGVRFKNEDAFAGCLEALRQREGVGVVNALLVGDVRALVIPLQVGIQPGTGKIQVLVQTHGGFTEAVNRARIALAKQGFLKDSDDVIATFDATEPVYSGSSIALAAAVGMYASARRMVIDRFTAFTGDVNLDRGEWRIKSVTGLDHKLAAARSIGCRRIFVPREGSEQVKAQAHLGMRIIPVDHLIEVFLGLEARLRPLVGTSPQVKRINALRAFAETRGWDVSEPHVIQDGVQFSLVSLQLPECRINIYKTGSFVPKQSDYPEYQELLDILRKAGQSQLELRNIEQTLNLPDASLRARIREGLERIGPVEKRQEQYCDYFFRFERGAEKLVVKQYSKGRLQVQGSAGDLYRDILEIVVPQYMLHYPQASVSVEQLLGASPVDRTVTSSDSDSMAKSPTQPSFPYIGTDESGKGDYFGPLVIAGVIVDEVTSERLKAAGVKDSKLLSDKRSRELAAQIREICKGKYQEVEIPPERYNELYEQFRRERKNLNHLLAWVHARAIESLLERAQCNNAVADQFGDESYISAKLMEKGKQIRLIQMPKAERFIAVAAASVLCRDRFLARLERISEEYGVSVPKGASEAVVVAAATILKKYGEAELRKTVKLHHRTTEKILKNDT